MSIIGGKVEILNLQTLLLEKYIVNKFQNIFQNQLAYDRQSDYFPIYITKPFLSLTTNI